LITKSELAGNALLADLPTEEYNRLLPHLQLVHLELGQAIYEGGAALDYGYFPDDAVISLLATLENGKSVEITLIGNEGVLGVTAALGATFTENASITQIPGSCWKIKIAAVRDEFKRCGVFHSRLLAYTLSLLTQISQTAACNRLHLLEQRMARWLLMVYDRCAQKEFPITHDFLSHMLGTPRSEITLAAGALRKAGIIQYSRGKIHILDPKRLEAVACECYRADQGFRHPPRH
jgi:CRP-like cAMP-binding protein